MDLEAMVQLARKDENLRWAVVLMERLDEAGIDPTLFDRWVAEAFEHLLYHQSLDTEQAARDLYQDLVKSGRQITSIVDVRELWPRRGIAEIAVLRLWTGLRLEGCREELGTALELLCDELSFGTWAREAPILLFRHSMTAHLSDPGHPLE